MGIEGVRAVAQSPHGQLRFGQLEEKHLSAFGEPRQDAVFPDRLIVGKYTFHQITEPSLKAKGVTHFSWIGCNDRLGGDVDPDAVCGHGGFAYINYDHQNMPELPPIQCLNCKAPMEEGDLFCPSCGAMKTLETMNLKDLKKTAHTIGVDDSKIANADYEEGG